MILIRFLLRFLLVPLAGCIAAMVAAFVVCFAHWTQFAKLVAANPHAPENIVLAVLIIGPVIALGTTIAAFAMLTPAALGVVISEIFAIRSWLFHVANGALASWVGWLAMEKVLKQFEFYDEPTILVAAGIAAGIAYWAIAGWTAGFWKPVFSQPLSPPAPPTAAAA